MNKLHKNSQITTTDVNIWLIMIIFRYEYSQKTIPKLTVLIYL